MQKICSKSGSNRLPPDLQSDALPNELNEENGGPSGIEPESCAPKAHILPLNYGPIKLLVSIN
jgi:hypothetical protein